MAPEARSIVPASPSHSRPERAAASRRAGRQASHAALIAALAMAAPGTALAWDFTPRVELTQTWIDNVTLAPSGLEESEWVTELRPGFSLGLQRPRANLLLDYDLQALWFADNSDFNDVYHQATGTGNFVLAPETLFLDSFLRYDQQNVDSSGRIAYTNLLQTGNRTDAVVFGASPYHIGRWGRWGESQLRYDYRTVRYTNTDEGVSFRLQDSDTHQLSGFLGSPSERPGLSWRASGSTSVTDYDLAPDFKYSRVALDVGVPVALRTRATATVGRESDVAEDRTKGDLDSSFWYLGVEWDPSELQSVRARVGNRYYGTAYDFSWRRRGSRGDMSVDYSEQPTTASGVLGDEGVSLPGYRPGGVPSLDTGVFLRKRLGARLSYDFVRATLGARAYTERRIYEEVGRANEETYGGTVFLDWDFAPRTRMGLTADWERREFEGAGRKDDLGELSARFSRDIGRNLTGTLRLSHFLRDSDQAADYDVNLVAVSLRAVF